MRSFAAPGSTFHASPWRWVRACAFGLVSASIGCVGHASVMHASHQWLILGISIVVFSCYARLFVEHRSSPTKLFLALGVGQTIIHVVLMAAMPAATHGSMSAHHAMSGAHASIAGMSFAMLFTHVCAVFAGFAILLGLERWAWRAAVNTVTQLVEVICELFAPGGRRTSTLVASRTQVFVDPALLALRRWIQAASGRRGPPAGRLRAT